ncbi:MAG: hypothetical protein IT555_21425 [Acetobacteraceae bacterium]|nr:hypothetical protein [Acetobacteraceae bacterium]
MSASDWTYLQGLAVSQFQNGGHRSFLVPAFNAVGQTGQDVAALATQAQASADSASTSYALQLSLGGGAYGVGTDPMRLPRTVQLNSAAFLDWQVMHGTFPSTQNATYQIAPPDFGKLLLCTSGTRTWTLPLATDLPDGWWCLVRNRSGNNLTLNLAGGAETINGGSAGAGISIATGTAIQRAIKTGSTSFEVA